MFDDWSALTVNERRLRNSENYCGFVKLTNGEPLFNYYGFIGRLGVVCSHISEVEGRNVPYKTVRRRIDKGVPFEDAVKADSFFSMKDARKKRRGIYPKCKRQYELNGKMWSLHELSRKYKVPYKTLCQRFRRGWSIEEAVGLEKRVRTQMYCVRGCEGTLSDLSLMFGISPKVVSSRLRRGWDVESAFLCPYKDINYRRKDIVTYDGERGSLSFMCRKFDVCPQSVYYRMRRYGLNKDASFAECVRLHSRCDVA